VLTPETMPVGLLHSLQKTVSLPYMPINPSHIPPIPPPPGPADPKDMSDAVREAVGSFYRGIHPDYGTANVNLADFEPAARATSPRAGAAGPESVNTGWHDKSSAEWDEERERRRERRRRMRKEEMEEEEQGSHKGNDAAPVGTAAVVADAGHEEPQEGAPAGDDDDPFEFFRRSHSIKLKVKVPPAPAEAPGCYRCGAMGHFKRDCTTIL